MALGTAFVPKADVQVFMPAKWTGKVNDFYRDELKAGAFFQDWSSDVADGAEIVYRPNITQMTAEAKTLGSQVVLKTNTETAITLTINVHSHTAFIIEDVLKSKIGKSYGAQEVYAKNAGYSVGAALEDAILLLFNGFSQIVGTSALALNDSNIRRAIEYLDVANVPQEDRAFFLHPHVIWSQLMGISTFQLQTNTAGADPVLKGRIGSLYGIPVVSTSRLSVTLGHRNGALAGKDAIAYATANLAGMGDNNNTVNKVRIQTDYLLEYLGDLVVADLMYGVIENRDTSGVWIKAKSS